jgi:N-carbamoylputrescine amidase
MKNPSCVRALWAALLLVGHGWALSGGELPERLRVASIQMANTSDLQANCDRILRGIAEARKASAQVAVFPETALPGFDPKSVSRLSWQELARCEKSIATAAKEAGIHVIYGSVTRREEGRPFNSAVVVGPGGEEITRYHKMVPEDCFEPGDHLAFFEVAGVPCTLIICHDERYPELVRLPVLMGARVCFYVSYEVNSLEQALAKMENYRAQLIARAAENGIWVVQSNGIGPEPDRPDGISLGHSRVVGPSGRVIREAPGLEDSMIVEDLTLAAATRGNALGSLGVHGLGQWWQDGISRAPKELEATGKSRAERENQGVRENQAVRDTPTTGPAALSGAAGKRTVRIGLLEAVPLRWELEANFKAFLHLLEAATRERVELLVTPEGWLDGYASPAPDSTPEKLRSVAQDPLTSPYLRRVATEAKARSMLICFGFTSLEEGKIYNAAGLWGPDGNLIGVYHKTHLQGHDLQYSQGESLPVWNTPWGPVGVMICADRRWPETARTLRLQGARLILNPSYGMHHEANEWWMRTRGYENQCFIAFCHPKVAFIVDPKGNIAGKLQGEPAGVLVREVDLTLARDDDHIRDRRPELYGPITAPRPERR